MEVSQEESPLSRILTPAWVFSALAVLLLALSGAWAQAQLPAGASLPIHWGLSGQADGFASSGPACYGVPVLAAALSVLMGLMALVDPRLRASEPSLRAYRGLWLGLLGLLGLTHVALISPALGLQLPVPRLVFIGVGLLLVHTGRLLRQVEPNGVLGIRTPATLADPAVWRRVHARCAKVFLWQGGALTLAAAVDAPPLALVAVLLGGIIFLTIATFKA